jgi:orotidine-5'-phosphate decarboxylase
LFLATEVKEAALKTLLDAFDQNGLGAIINNSRGIIFAHRSEAFKEKYGESRWEEAVEASTRDMIEALAAETTASNL